MAPLITTRRGNLKRCPACSKWKRIDRFGVNRSRHDGRQAHCGACFATRYRLKTAEARRKQHIWVRYRLSWEKYLSLYEMQARRCAICQDPIKLLGSLRAKDGAHVDHNHQTQQVRGLLCHGCNTAIGSMQESPSRLQAAREYLLRTNAKDSK